MGLERPPFCKDRETLMLHPAGRSVRDGSILVTHAPMPDPESDMQSANFSDTAGGV